jgi:hypothetical protein
MGLLARCGGPRYQLLATLQKEKAGRPTVISRYFCATRVALFMLETQAFIARQLGYLAPDSANDLDSLLGETGKMLNGLISSMRTGAQHKRGTQGFASD